MSSSRPFSIVWRKSENQLSSRYCVTMPGRGCTKTPPKPLSLRSAIASSIRSGVTTLFQTKSGAEPYSLEGAANCALRLSKSSAAGRLRPSGAAQATVNSPKRGHIALRNVRFIGCITSQINSWFVLSAVYEFSAGRRHRPSAEKSVVRICDINTRGSAPSPC